jgi:nucleoid DNA-binding protein
MRWRSSIITKTQALVVLEDLVGLIIMHLKNGERVKIAGLGVLQVRNRAARMGRNPKTGEQIQIKASKPADTDLPIDQTSSAWRGLVSMGCTGAKVTAIVLMLSLSAPSGGRGVGGWLYCVYARRLAIRSPS